MNKEGSKYTRPNVVVINFSYDDIIRTSTPPCSGVVGCGDIDNAINNQVDLYLFKKKYNK